jgi:hypothetical protein
MRFFCRLKSLSYIVAFVWICFAASAPTLPAVPAIAADVGYNTNTYSTNFNTYNVDVARTGRSGFLWYPWDLYGYHARTSAFTFNADGSVTLAGDTTGPNGQLTSATPARNAAGFVGKAFGGGAYIEAVFKFNPADVARANGNGWPSFWSLALEGSALSQNQWPGQATGYVHGIEADFFEYLLVNRLTMPLAYINYGAGMHDWYGIPNKTCYPGLCQAPMPYFMGQKTVSAGTDFTVYHSYGFLWVPATVTTKGYARYYFDGKQVGQDWQWSQYTNQPPRPNNQPWAFGILDQQHLVLIFGTGPGEPMTIVAVNVWQKSDAQNLRN